MNNYDGYSSEYSSEYESCGGCSCGSNPGCDYQTCSPDYNPVTVNNSTCPNVEGSTSQGGSASGNTSNNTSSVSVNMCCCKNDSSKDCCVDGVKKLLNFIQDKSLEATITSSQVYLYGDLVTEQEELFTPNPANTPLLSLINSTQIQNASICNEIIKLSNTIVSLCTVSLVAFSFEPKNQNAYIKKKFKFIKKCSCSCECNEAIAEALCFSGFGGTYTVRLKDTLKISTNGTLSGPATLTNLFLVAVDNNIAIFSNALTPTLYYGIPTCKIASFIKS